MSCCTAGRVRIRLDEALVAFMMWLIPHSVWLARREGSHRAYRCRSFETGPNQVVPPAGSSPQVIGCCGLTFDAAPSDVVEATGAPERCEYALLTGLAVTPPLRRRGVASALLAAAAEEVHRGLGSAQRQPPALLALLVSKLNMAARR